MSNRWNAALAWIASMSVVWTLFVPRGVSLGELLAVSVVGFLVLGVSALWAKDQDTENQPRAVPMTVRLSKGR